MAFIFSTSHLPETRVRRPDHLEEEEDEDSLSPPPRAGMVRAFSHLPEPLPLADTSGPLSTRPATPVGRPRPYVDPVADIGTDEDRDTDHAPGPDSDHEDNDAPRAHDAYAHDTPWHQPRITSQDLPPQSHDADEGVFGGTGLTPKIWKLSQASDHSIDGSWAPPTHGTGFEVSPLPERGAHTYDAGYPLSPADSASARDRESSRPSEIRPHPLLTEMSGFGSDAATHGLRLGKLGIKGRRQTGNPQPRPSALAAAAPPHQSPPAAVPATPASKPPPAPGTADGAVAANSPVPGSGEPDQRSNISIDDGQKSPFAKAVEDALNRELQESPTTAAIMKAVRSLPNKIRIIPKQGQGEATMSIGDDGTVTIEINLQKLSGSTFGHELSHVIQRVAYKNEYKEAIAKPDKNNPNPFTRARKKASEALNQIIKVAYHGDPGDDHTENEAVRVSNIVNAERTAAKIKEQFKGRANVSPEEIAKAFWLEARKLEEGKHFRNTHAIPMLTRYGNHDFIHVADTLGNGVTPEMLKKVRNSMDDPPRYQTFYIPPAPASQPAKRPR